MFWIKSWARLSLIVSLALSCPLAMEAMAEEKAQVAAVPTLSDFCLQQLTKFEGPIEMHLLKKACDRAQVIHECESVEKRPLFHIEKPSARADGKRVLVFSLIHGDETGAGTIGRYWLERLEGIQPRNHWRVIPVLNPDGVLRKTRTNANQVDVNRNFPTKDWEEKATSYWKKDQKSNPRRFPGPAAASEPETKCALKHIEDFKPDFVVSIHTPLNVLDFDGPKIKPPDFKYIPWKSLGHYPGSLGRFMWFERHVPVLTMELKPEVPSTMEPFEKLQDLLGLLVSIEFKQR